MGHVKQEKSTNSNNTSNTEPPSFIEFITLKDHTLSKRTDHQKLNTTEETQAIGYNHSNADGKDKIQQQRNQYPKQLNAEELISQINCNLNNSNSHNNSVAHHNNTNNNNNTSNNLQIEVRNSSNNNDSNNNNNRSNQQQQNRPQQQQQQQADNVEVDDIEKGSDDQSQRNRRQKPLLRRLYSFIRNLWIGATFNVGKADCELEELETTPRYRPDSLAQICKTTRFSEVEIKRMYRGFKAHCPNGVVKEDTFKIIYAQFFPQGANTGLYAHYVFNTLDKDHTGTLSFEKFVQGLSILSRGTLEEKLCWTFQLYDINSDGHITKEEMSDIVTAVYSLMGHPGDGDKIDEEKIKEKVENLFDKMDRNHDGVVTIDEFLDCCRYDQAIKNSMLVFDSSF